MTQRDAKPGLPTLAQATFETAIAVVEAELRAVRAQVSDALVKITTGGGLIAAGAGFALVAQILLAQGLYHAVALLVGPAGAGLILGLGFMIFGCALIWRGQKRIKSAQFVPDRYRDRA